MVFSGFMEARTGPETDPRSGEETLLLEGIRRGEERAFQRLVSTYGPGLKATALRLVRNEADANDVVQEAFLGAVRGLPAFEGRSALGTWLHRIAVNAALMKLRTRARRPEADIHDLLPRFGDGGNHLEPASTFADLPEERAARRESAAIVRKCIDRLPERYRTALVLKDIEELDYKEVAESLGLTMNAARVRVHRARQALRKLLIPHFGESDG